MSGFRGKADMAFCGNPLSRSLFGVKRTSLFAAQMPASDPKRTSVPETDNPFQYAGLRRYDAFVKCHGSRMRRRDFITLFGVTATTWPLPARAQQTRAHRLIGMLNILGPDDPEGDHGSVLEQTLQKLGWTVGRDLKIENRWVGGDVTAFAAMRRNSSDSRRTRSLVSPAYQSGAATPLARFGSCL